MPHPARDAPIAAVLTITTSPIAEDSVIRNTGGDRDLVDRNDETVIRGQRVDTVRKTLQLKGRRIRRSRLADGLTDGDQLARRFHQHRSDAADPVSGQVTAAMRSGHKNHAPDFRSMLENDCLLEEAFTVGRQLCLCWRLSEGLEPVFVPGVGDESSADASTHAMTDEHHLSAQRKFLFDGVEFLAEDERAIGIGITAGVTVKPKLIVAPEILVADQIV